MICTCQMWDVSHFDALKWLNFHMRILNMDHSETELLLVTRMASTFFLLPFCFKPFIQLWYCHLVCWKYDRDLLKDNQIGLSWELLTYVRTYFRITVCQKASATILINHNIGLKCQLLSYFVIFFEIVIEGRNFRCTGFLADCRMIYARAQVRSSRLYNSNKVKGNAANLFRSLV